MSCDNIENEKYDYEPLDLKNVNRETAIYSYSKILGFNLSLSLNINKVDMEVVQSVINYNGSPKNKLKNLETLLYIGGYTQYYSDALFKWLKNNNLVNDTVIGIRISITNMSQSAADRSAVKFVKDMFFEKRVTDPTGKTTKLPISDTVVDFSYSKYEFLIIGIAHAFNVNYTWLYANMLGLPDKIIKIDKCYVIPTIRDTYKAYTGESIKDNILLVGIVNNITHIISKYLCNNMKNQLLYLIIEPKCDLDKIRNKLIKKILFFSNSKNEILIKNKNKIIKEKGKSKIDSNMCFNCNSMTNSNQCYQCDNCDNCYMCIECSQCKNISFLKNVSNYDSSSYLDYCNQNLSNNQLQQLFNLTKDIKESDYSTGLHTLEKLLVNDINLDKVYTIKYILGFKQIIYLLIHIYDFPKEILPTELIDN